MYIVHIVSVSINVTDHKVVWKLSPLSKTTLFDVLVSTFLDVWNGVLMFTPKIFHCEGWSNAPYETRDGNERPPLKVLLDHPLGCY